MKRLPVVQPPAPTASERPVDERSTRGVRLQIADMVDDPQASAALRSSIVAALSTVFDPEIPVNIYDLGLVYDVIVDAERRVGIRMTLTAPACPAAQSLPNQVTEAVAAVPTITSVIVDLVWEPAWNRDRMSEAAKLQLGMF
jgi:FeS assembly SUF system protein